MRLTSDAGSALRFTLAAIAFAFLAIAAPRAQTLQHFDTTTLEITTSGGAQKFDIELAITPEQQQQGLMFRSAMKPDAGMLFEMPEDQTAVFWMHNTLIPLDMLFIASDGHVADIHERAVPMTDDNVVSKVPVRAVLELNGGTVARLGIKIGDVVHYKFFGNAG